jgi:hypothetical protein
MRIVRILSTMSLLVPWTLCAGAFDQQGSTPAASLPVAAQAGISACLGRDASQYHARAVRGGFETTTPSQRFDTRFTAQGAAVSSGRVRWSMALEGYGYGVALQPVQVVMPQANLNRVEYRRASLTEWYVNGPMGLEQGFTLSDRPAQKDGQPLTLAVVLAGDLTGSVDEDGSGLTLNDANGRARLRYTGLKATDATGKELKSWVEVRSNRMFLRVEDGRAHYPVVIDPFVQLAELTASDGASGDEFGISVSLSGNTAVVGAQDATIGSNAQQGAAYIFIEPAGGWTTSANFTAKLTASDGLAGDNFGSATAISGNTVVIGACSQSGVCNNGPGKVYVFVKPPSGWVTTSRFKAELTASDGVATDGFGGTVGISGTTVVAGSPQSNGTTATGPGKAYVFAKPASGWANMTETAELDASGAQTGDGAAEVSVANNGAIVFVGAPGTTVASKAEQGAAYIFLRPASGWKTTSKFKAKLIASNGAAGDAFGFCQAGSICISSDGKTVVAGAPQISGGGAGKAYVFVEPATGWASTPAYNAELTASNGATGDLLGWSVSVSGNGSAAAVGALGVNSLTGAVYVFAKPASGWRTTSHFNSELTPSDGVSGDAFGFSSSLSGTDVFVGALNHPSGANPGPGAAYVFGP